MCSQIQRTPHLFDFGKKDADVENYRMRQPVVVRIGGWTDSCAQGHQKGWELGWAVGSLEDDIGLN